MLQVWIRLPNKLRCRSCIPRLEAPDHRQKAPGLTPSNPMRSNRLVQPQVLDPETCRTDRFSLMTCKCQE
jgi:hypothetical protein